jgi:DNA ligase D-like protein (predicted ligase)
MTPLDVLTPSERGLLRYGVTPGWRPPMLATLTERRFSDPAWVFERKYDGVRGLTSRDGDTPELWSRNERLMGQTYPELVDALSVRGGPRFVADGEIVAFDGKQTSFSKLQARINLTKPEDIRRTGVAVYYYLFDLLVLDDADLTRLPLRARKRVLRQAFEYRDPLRYSVHRNTHGERFYADACSRGWEGLIAKRADSPYRHTRSRDWLKFKCVRDQEFVIGGFTEPRGSRPGFGALLVGYYDDGALRYAGKVGTGYSETSLRELRALLDQLEQPSSPFADPVGEKNAHWVRPTLVAQIGFTEWTHDDKLRHPRFMGLRYDKPAWQVVRETE